jgi:hypothetical protein
MIFTATLRRRSLRLVVELPYPMRIFEFARKPPQWLRVVLAGLMLAFALNSIAHAAHTHDAKTTITVAHSACGYCATFGGLGGSPVYAHSLPVPALIQVEAAGPREVPVARRPTFSAQPRAPPVH